MSSTPKQRANPYGRQHVKPKPKPEKPKTTESWWSQPMSRQEFAAMAEQQRARMKPASGSAFERGPNF